jgi:Ca2+-binding RTX toxin-like protein
LVTAVTILGMLAFGAQAALADVGDQGPAFKNPAAPSGTQSAFGNPSGEKPESKLWYHDGRWWAVMWDIVEGNYHIWGLNASQNWVDTGVTVDGRKTSRQDVLKVGGKLYIASHRVAGASESASEQSRLYRYTYNPATDKYVLDAGFPSVINNVRSQTLVIDRDSTGRLWATWTQASGGGRAVMVASSGTGANWTAPTALANVTSMDISSVIAFGNQVGIMWNNGTTDFRFRTHPAGTGGSWSATEIAYASGGDGADDHINLKAVGGTVYAAVKTTSSGAVSGPLVLILRRDGVNSWSNFGVVNSRWSRPIVEINTQSNTLYVLANAAPGQKSGTIFMKQAALGSLNTLAGAAETVFIQRGAGGNPGMVDVTSSKGNISNVSGLVALASDEGTDHYWHGTIAGTDPPPPPPPVDNGPNVIRGTRGNDRLVGTSRRDIILGGRGRDRIYGFGGNDRLVGGRGKDRIVGGRGRDRMLGQAGNDTLISKDRFRDAVLGGRGIDRARRNRGDRLRSIERII